MMSASLKFQLIKEVSIYDLKKIESLTWLTIKYLFRCWTNYHAIYREAISTHFFYWYVCRIYLWWVHLYSTAIWRGCDVIIQIWYKKGTWCGHRQNIFTGTAVLNILFQLSKMCSSGYSTRETAFLKFLVRKHLNRHFLHSQQFYFY